MIFDNAKQIYLLDNLCVNLRRITNDGHFSVLVISNDYLIAFSVPVPRSFSQTSLSIPHPTWPQSSRNLRAKVAWIVVQVDNRKSWPLISCLGNPGDETRSTSTSCDMLQSCVMSTRRCWSMWTPPFCSIFCMVLAWTVVPPTEQGQCRYS